MNNSVPNTRLPPQDKSVDGATSSLLPQDKSVGGATAIGGSFQYIAGKSLHIKGPETTEVITPAENILRLQKKLGVLEVSITEAVARPVKITVEG